MYIYGVHVYVFMSRKLCMHTSMYVHMCVSKFIHMYEGQRVELDILIALLYSLELMKQHL